MTRPKYKQLYRQAQADARREQGRRQALQHRLFQIKQTLARIGHAISREIPEGSEPFEVGPHDYLCLESYLESLQRFTRDESEEPENAYTQIVWRGRPIRRTE